jgi:hypothetical protein
MYINSYVTEFQSNLQKAFATTYKHIKILAGTEDPRHGIILPACLRLATLVVSMITWQCTGMTSERVILELSHSLGTIKYHFSLINTIVSTVLNRK